MVCGWRHDRAEGIARRWPSRAANWLIRRISGLRLHDFGTTFRAYRAELAKEIRLFGEFHRYVPVLGHLAGAPHRRRSRSRTSSGPPGRAATALGGRRASSSTCSSSCSSPASWTDRCGPSARSACSASSREAGILTALLVWAYVFHVADRARAQRLVPDVDHAAAGLRPDHADGRPGRDSGARSLRHRRPPSLPRARRVGGPQSPAATHHAPSSGLTPMCGIVGRFAWDGPARHRDGSRASSITCATAAPTRAPSGPTTASAFGHRRLSDHRPVVRTAAHGDRRRRPGRHLQRRDLQPRRAAARARGARPPLPHEPPTRRSCSTATGHGASTCRAARRHVRVRDRRPRRTTSSSWPGTPSARSRSTTWTRPGQ